MLYLIEAVFSASMLRADHAPLSIALQPLDKTNVTQLKLLNASLLPIHYTERFYRAVLQRPSHSRLAFANGKHVGMICCREERKGEEHVLYIMTLGCLVMFRRRGVGSALVRFVVELAREVGAARIQLHVHSINEDAVMFYQRFGFVVREELPGYYRYLTPPSAVLLVKELG